MREEGRSQGKYKRRNGREGWKEGGVEFVGF
jgi:hypothetical protein